MDAGDDGTAEFERHRGRLFGLAYRMLGSAADAHDVVQDAWLRWARSDRDAVRAPGAWLAAVVTNLCLNHLDSARVRRERYVGPWLPEPVCTESGALGPLERVQDRESVSSALLTLFERLTPTERAVVVLREAFDYDHRTIAGVLGVTESHSRQLLRRATARLAEDRRRFEPDLTAWRRLVERFLDAAREGELSRLEGLLADDVVSWSDGGGLASAARRPVYGAATVARMFAGLARRAAEASVAVGIRDLNGAPGLVAHHGGVLVAAIAPEIRDGRIVALRATANPEKLRYLQDQIGADLSRAVTSEPSARS